MKNTTMAAANANINNNIETIFGTSWSNIKRKMARVVRGERKSGSRIVYGKITMNIGGKDHTITVWMNINCLKTIFGKEFQPVVYAVVDYGYGVREYLYDCAIDKEFFFNAVCRCITGAVTKYLNGDDVTKVSYGENIAARNDYANPETSELKKTKAVVQRAIDWLDTEDGKEALAGGYTSVDGITDGDINDHTVIDNVIYDGDADGGGALTFNVSLDGTYIYDSAEWPESIDECFSYSVDDLDVEQIADDILEWVAGVYDHPHYVYVGARYKSDTGDIYEVLAIDREYMGGWKWFVKLKNINTNQTVNCIGNRLLWSDQEEFINWDERVA